MGFKQAPSLPYSKLGYVEDGDYASRAYEKDEIIIWKGGNYFTKTDILQGAEFVVDTNLTAIPDGVLNGIMAKVSALSDHLAQSMTDFTPLYGETTDQVYDKTITVSDNITNYKYIYGAVFVTSQTLGGDILYEFVFIPVSLLRSTYAHGIQANGYTSGRTYLIISYVSDTQFHVQASGKYKIFGIK